MRLEHRDDAALERRARRRKRRLHLFGMMRIVIDDDAPGGLALDLEAAADARKFRQRFRRNVKSNSQLQRDRDRGQRIHRDVHSRRGNRHLAKHFALAHHFKARRETIDDDFLGAQIGVRAQCRR